ncbi:DUF6063 family protein [Paenibacillus sp. FSL L8-0638]|uniref:DUF6063 family protein n=1 Tax=Paenibacillus TaxID=44249 RepID=UPI0031587586
MQYFEEEVIQAFRIYTLLAQTGEADADSLQLYETDDKVRGLVDQFAAEVECAALTAGGQLYLIPLARLSPFHMSNDTLKKTYLRGSAVNADLYLMYLAVMILIGAFYDSYQTTEPTRNFLTMNDWLLQVQERVGVLQEHGNEQLERLSKEFSYRWSEIVERWNAMDDIKENAKRQSGQTISRISFLDTVRRFLLDQRLVSQVGPDELDITEKTKIIVQRYFMEAEYNRGILEFLYAFKLPEDEEEKTHASDLQD